MSQSRKPNMTREQRRLQEALRLQRRYKRAASRRCTFCEEFNWNNRRCSLCKSVRYCDEECQRADYVARHRQECTDFTHPPLTAAFVTEPIGRLKHAPATVFAHGHRDGVGCWISVRGTKNADLVEFASLFSMRPSEEGVRRKTMLAASFAGHHHEDDHSSWHARRLLTLQVLVQNRRKDGQPVLVLAALSQALSLSDETSLQGVMQKQRDVDAPSIFVDEDLRHHAVFKVATSNWDEKPRIYIANYDGAKLELQRHPPSILDAERGFVVLNPGQFAIVYLQFCVGDGSVLTKEWQALRCLERIVLPCISPWDGVDRDAAASYDADQLDAAASSRGIACAVDAEAVEDYYQDSIRGNEAAFAANHYHGGDQAPEPVPVDAEALRALEQGFPKKWRSPEFLQKLFGRSGRYENGGH
ncbi:hypothetical protein L226DRAFT_571041 [Lentinus tigrinus ALCF2SS1-7]|uniref:MYND-type domain-containing protein n=1 Tax=Lentinus tigrinus ALCF2SS1-6 TaxID=1328759 RepID=A0A5C2SA77_9APHY|nr:hypothetical protein L227DRAFT_611444 [Lentinus tigrinus ALCF2SS1-6]RPD74754.1 hypothetical protein L226DRAFT_571041 [Lentinus tigrinus ALCF2SS1-7]